MTDSVTWKGVDMRQSENKFKNWVMSFTYQERRNKQLEIFRKQLEDYSSMDKAELNFEYFNCIAEYEHKKNILTLVIISIAVSLIMNIWEKIFSFLSTAIKYDNYMNDSQDTFMICLIIASAIGLTFVVVIVIILSTIFNDLKQLKKKIQLIEYVKSEEENED